MTYFSLYIYPTQLLFLSYIHKVCDTQDGNYLTILLPVGVFKSASLHSPEVEGKVNRVH